MCFFLFDKPSWLTFGVSIRIPISGKDASSEYKILQTRQELFKGGPGASLVEWRLLTGRKHQLRIHALEGLGAPIFGDWRYGCSKHKSSLEQFARHVNFLMIGHHVTFVL